MFGGEHTAHHLQTDLRTSPYAPFAASTTPVALYARRWWLEEDSVALRRAERRRTGRIHSLQRADGSFGGLIPTIRFLFALQLLQRNRTHESDKAIDWLWETGLPSMEVRRLPDGVVYHDLLVRLRRGDPVRLNRMTGTPFSRGCAIFVKTSAGILLSSAFGRGREARVQRAMRCLDDVIEARGSLWCSPACSVNILSALVANPDGAKGRGVVKAVRAIGKMQSGSGTWPGMPFAATLHSLASLDIREARAQVRRALPALRRAQNRDGSWGRGPNREFTSFQVVQALRAIEA